jgi:plasmid replication initiation protein
VITPIPSAKIENGVLEVVLWREAVPYFIDLKKRGYTSYELDVALSLTSVYSQRMFELLSRWKDTGKWYGVDIQHLKFLLGIDKDKTYNGVAANGKMRQAILEPSRIELAEKTDLEFDYSFEKEGRKFVRINFDVRTKKLVQHIKTADAKADAVSILEQLSEATQGQQMIFLHTALPQ